MGCPESGPFFVTENCGWRKRIAKDLAFAEQNVQGKGRQKTIRGKCLQYLRILRYIDDTRVMKQNTF